MILICAILVTLITVAWLGVRRYGLRRGQEKAAPDDALRKLYGQYWTEVRALTQTHLLEAPSDEEWLARIKDQAGTQTAKVSSCGTELARDDELAESAMIIHPRYASAVRAQAEARLRARVEHEKDRGSRRHQRLPRWMRWIPLGVSVFDFGLLLYFFAGITDVRWAEPLSSSSAVAALSAAGVTVLSYGFLAFVGRRIRTRKDHSGAVQLNELGASTGTAAGFSVAVTVAFAALGFTLMRAEALNVLGARAGFTTLALSLIWAAVTAGANLSAIAVYALDGSAEVTRLARLSAARRRRLTVRSSMVVRHSPRKSILLRWLLRLAGAAIALAIPATVFYFHHSVVAVMLTMVILPVGYFLGLIIVVYVAVGRERYLDRTTQQPEGAARGARRLFSFSVSRDSALRSDEANWPM
jgi:hypothetical protein